MLEGIWKGRGGGNGGGGGEDTDVKTRSRNEGVLLNAEAKMCVERPTIKNVKTKLWASPSGEIIPGIGRVTLK